MKNWPVPKSDKEPSQRAAALFKGVEQVIENLYFRWLDEREYEDIKDYARAIIPIVNRYGCEFVRMSKKPFGFDFKADGRTYALRVGNKTYSYKRIA